MSSLLNNDTLVIRDVWGYNLEKEFSMIRDIIDDFPNVAMDTEFPGIVVRGFDKDKTYPERCYFDVRVNVKILKLIQLGLTFSDEKGMLPKCGTDKYCIWQFNFREFDVSKDPCFEDSVKLLARCGIDLEKNREMGVDIRRFGELLMSSGVVLNDRTCWITFQSAYDFGYLIKLLTGKKLPLKIEEFYERIKVFCPVFYDVKYLVKFCNGLYGGLERLAGMLGVQRIGVSHQAGSDSLLTCRIFMKLKEHFFYGFPVQRSCVLYGYELDS